jgi:outer membrane protein OmpA-like peptidoglycan-associated protein
MYIEIGGHTDNIGSASYNKWLSMERAKSVAQYLIDRGIPEYRLEYVGYGLEKPIADNATASGRQQNRRTEFKILEE